MPEVMENPNRVRRRVQFSCSGKSRTEQHHVNQTNINSIMARFKKTGLLPQRGEAGFYGDFSNVEDYHTCVNRVMEAERNFLTLPSAVRDRFDNDPAKLLAFLENADNRKEAMELGIIPKPVPQAPVEPETPVVNPETPENP